VTCTYFGALSVEEYLLRLGQNRHSPRHLTMSRGFPFCGDGLQPGAELGAGCGGERSEIEGATELIF